MIQRPVFVATVLAAAFGMGTTASAADLNGSYKDVVWATNAIIDSNNQLGVQFVATHFDYKEVYRGELLDTEKGWVPGIGVSVSLMRNWGVENLYLNARVSYLSGETDYKGSYIGSDAGYGSVVAKSDADVWDVDFRVGKGFALRRDFMVTPFFGLGFHDWDRGVNEGEDYSHGYYGVGLLLQYSPTGKLVLSVDGLIGRTFNSHIDVAGPDGFSGDLGDSTIYKLGFSGDYALSRSLHLTGGVEYTHFKYGQSDVYNGYLEPPSKTSNVTAKVGLGYTLSSDPQPLK
jgi:hypothetical protein